MHLGQTNIRLEKEARAAGKVDLLKGIEGKFPLKLSHRLINLGCTA